MSEANPVKEAEFENSRPCFSLLTFTGAVVYRQNSAGPCWAAPALGSLNETSNRILCPCAGAVQEGPAKFWRYTTAPVLTFMHKSDGSTTTMAGKLNIAATNRFVNLPDEMVMLMI